MTALEVASKTCTKCEDNKPLSEFYRQAGTPDGHKYSCKECEKARVADYQARKREEMGDEAWRAYKLKAVSRHRAARRDGRSKESASAYNAALFALRDLHRDQFDRLLAAERYERGLDA
jgi:hypothetical protein